MDVVVFGCLIARAAAPPGESASGSGVFPGGKAATQALAAARLGCSTAVVGRVGRDSPGKELLAALRGAGVDVSGVLEDPQAATGTPESPGANGRLGSGDGDRAATLLAPGSFLLLQLEPAAETVVHAAAMARTRGASIFLDASPARALPPPLWRTIDVLVVTAEGSELVCGVPVRDLDSARAAARRIRQRGPSTAVVALGADGAFLEDAASAFHRPAPQVGGGVEAAAVDAFVAAFAATLKKGRKPSDALDFALAAAAAARGGVPPTLGEVEALLRGSG